jgi:hypothetical protein
MFLQLRKHEFLLLTSGGLLRFRELTQRHPSGYFLQQTGAKTFRYSGGRQSFSKLRLA